MKTKRKSLKLKIFLGIFFVILLIILGIRFFIRNAIRSHPLPVSLNMSSSMDMKDMESSISMFDKQSTVAAISIDTLRLPVYTIAPLKTYVLTAQVVKRAGLPDEWTYNGIVPGPVIRVKQGDHLHIVLVNHLPVATTIHWHGVQVPNTADGVAGLTQDGVKPGQSYVYDFIAKEPGTYWYHSHDQTFEQEPKGLFGTLIVDPLHSLHYDHDYSLVYHDSLIKPLGILDIIWQRIQQSFGKQVRQPLEVNGSENPVMEAKAGDTVRLRLVNASSGDMTGAPLRILPLGTHYKVIALDGHAIYNPQDLTQKILPIGQGQRYDIVFSMPASGVVSLVDLQNGEVVTVGKGAIALPINAEKFSLFDLTSYGKLDNSSGSHYSLASHFDATYPVVLGNKPGFRSGSIQLIHTINGKAFPEIPAITVREGQLIHLHIINATDETHPMHLHGHIFQILAINSKPVVGSPIRMDSVLVFPHQTADVAFIADNPGLWMFHCHVLIHANFGMDMMVVYPNISTPYTIGTKSGNFPD